MWVTEVHRVRKASMPLAALDGKNRLKRRVIGKPYERRRTARDVQVSLAESTTVTSRELRINDSHVPTEDWLWIPFFMDSTSFTSAAAMKALSESATRTLNTPPPEVRTDPERGTGELGFESTDASHPFGGQPREGQETGSMWYLYGSKDDETLRLAATFDSEQQLLAYVHWATLQAKGERAGKFEQGSALAPFRSWQESKAPLTDDDPQAVVHNPSPSML